MCILIYFNIILVVLQLRIVMKIGNRAMFLCITIDSTTLLLSKQEAIGLKNELSKCKNTPKKKIVTFGGQLCFQSIINKQMSIIVKSKMKKWKGNQKVTTFSFLESTSSNQKYHHNHLSISLQMLPSTNCLQIAPTILLQLPFNKVLIFR